LERLQVAELKKELEEREIEVEDQRLLVA